MYLISKEHLEELLQWASGEYRVFIPARVGGALHFKPYVPGIEFDTDLGGTRCIESAKPFFFPPRQCVARGFDRELPPPPEKPVCLVGLKACDLRGLEVLDAALLEADPPDPLYARACEDGLIIASDCTEALDTCFCTAVREHPHPLLEFDLNLSPVAQGYVTVTASEKGDRLVAGHPDWFPPAPDDAIAEREALRQRVEESVRANVAAAGIPEGADLAQAFSDGYDAPLWEEFAETCVECGACNTACPTCHCFLLHDRLEDGNAARYRSWDACLLKDFARCAGGGNPRMKLWMRLRHRFETKFDFFPKTADLIACTGCGRCISACPAGIDIRAVLRRLVDYGDRDQSLPAHTGSGT